LASPVSKKQQEKQPETKTVDIQSQKQKPLSNHKNLPSGATAQFCTNLHNSEQSLNNQQKPQFSKISNQNLPITGFT
jgi:hypothetical protein